MAKSEELTYSEIFKMLNSDSDNNLNQLIKGDSLVVPSEYNEEFASHLKLYIEKVIETYKDKPDEIEEIIEPEFEESNGKFFEWIISYFENTMEPIRETAFLKEFSIDEFKSIIEYTMEKYVILFSGELIFDDMPESLSTEKIDILKKLLFTVSDMIIMKRFSKDYFSIKMKEIFNIESDFVDMLWNEIIKYEDALWKLLLCRKIERVENKVDELSLLVNEDYA